MCLRMAEKATHKLVMALDHNLRLVNSLLSRLLGLHGSEAEELGLTVGGRGIGRVHVRLPRLDSLHGLDSHRARAKRGSRGIVRDGRRARAVERVGTLKRLPLACEPIVHRCLGKRAD